MEQNFNHFAAIESRIVNDENHRFEKNTLSEHLPEFYFSRFLLMVTAAPTVLVTLITYMFKFRILYLLLFFVLYFGTLIACTETHFEWISDFAVRFRRFLTH